MSDNIFIKHDVPVIDSFIEKFARKYIEQRSQTNVDLNSLSENQLFGNHGFDSSHCLKILFQRTLLQLILKENKA